jgi:hypothetical protein
LLSVPLIAAGPDAFDRVVLALAAGDAQTLADTAAQPIDTPDLAVSAKPRQAYRNRALGPAYRKVALAPGATARFEQTFFAGQRARVAVVPVDRAVFALAVTDDDGASQCDSSARCDWTPLWTTRYRVALDNRGPRPASFFVVMQ